MADQEQQDNDQGVDPIEFLRRLLAISPEDAAKAREDAARRDAPKGERGAPRGQER